MINFGGFQAQSLKHTFTWKLPLARSPLLVNILRQARAREAH